jgi:uncharacterized membrane protein YeaQ/YmgE (transglycosylase-associated protein family)
MTTFAMIDLMVGGIFVWLLVGLMVGLAAPVCMQGTGYGSAIDLAIGVIGALAGGFLVGLLTYGVFGFLGSIVGAFLGAYGLLAGVRALAPRVPGPR